MKEPDLIDVEMPDGTIISEVPAGTSQSEIIRRYSLSQKQSRPPAPQTPAERALRQSALTDVDVARMTAPGKASGIQPIENVQDRQGRTAAGLLAGAAALGVEAAPYVGPVARVLGPPALKYGPKVLKWTGGGTIAAGELSRLVRELRGGR
jgi:hypothetical protein